MRSSFQDELFVIVSIGVFETDEESVVADATRRIMVNALENHVVIGMPLRMFKPEGSFRAGLYFVNPYVFTIAYSDSSDIVLVGYFDHESEEGAVYGPATVSCAPRHSDKWHIFDIIRRFEVPCLCPNDACVRKACDVASVFATVAGIVAAIASIEDAVALRSPSDVNLGVQVAVN